MHTHFGCERWHQAAAFALRYDVFVLEQGISLQNEFDERDTEERNYFVVYEASLAVATIRYQKKDDDTIQPDRFCVRKEYRGKGLGRNLLLLLEDKAMKDGFKYSILSAEKTALSFYQALNYSINSEEYLEDGIVCVEMIKKLSS
ncbi:GNAT family N-acetyltransferase [Enterococcus plantarum]|uniref:GNAT family N-acetyltransferase n=1 Tax=Enterococcus plantarum TaxID=1077675 RepID=A0A2W3ZA71_9ENTE|nr:GNAT family N-acetyltransferase [Enterococcus plantarum]MBO0468466.1 GNAT family N-acetyltransferase [Enterococcus plantarum]PZL76671.1 GNAT family N-acetyltransferase [Enterococcus plantarum]